MATFLFDKIIFGPVKSRRLGISLGINLLPTESKLCNFNCIYCECGWTDTDVPTEKKKFHTRETVKEALENKLIEMHAKGETPDVITFAGNGEPTMHPHFAGIIDDTIEIRDKHFPNARIAVLSNATMLHKKAVVTALRKADQNILKIDSAFEETINILNLPKKPIMVDKLVEQLDQFEGDFILQTMFVKGEYKGQHVDNTTDEELEAWLEILNWLKPNEVMIYTIARDTPLNTLEKISQEKLEEIAHMVNNLGIKSQVSG